MSVGIVGAWLRFGMVEGVRVQDGSRMGPATGCGVQQTFGHELGSRSLYFSCAAKVIDGQTPRGLQVGGCYGGLRDRRQCHQRVLSGAHLGHEGLPLPPDPVRGPSRAQGDHVVALVGASLPSQLRVMNPIAGLGSAATSERCVGAQKFYHFRTDEGTSRLRRLSLQAGLKSPSTVSLGESVAHDASSRPQPREGRPRLEALKFKTGAKALNLRCSGPRGVGLQRADAGPRQHIAPQQPPAQPTAGPAPQPRQP